jgi:hypothetical protein
MSRSRRLALLLAGLLAALALGAPSAQAESLAISDPSGDATGPLDLTGATFDNGPSRVVVTVAVDRVSTGNVGVDVQTRGGPGLVIGAFRRPGGRSVVRAFAGNFGGDVEARVHCRGLSARWDVRRATVRITLPGRCLAGGEYGDLRFVLLSEDRQNDDSDVAPAHGDRYHPTRWISRG